MTKYLIQVKLLLNNFISCRFHKIPHLKNSQANALARLASLQKAKLAIQIQVEELECSSIEDDKPEMNAGFKEAVSWKMPIEEYLCIGNLFEDLVKAKRIKRQSSRYMVLDGDLYRQGYSPPT